MGSGNKIIAVYLKIKKRNYSQYMHKRLDELGIENKLTRDSDETLSPEVRPKRIQDQFGSGDDVIVVSNHINQMVRFSSYRD